MDKGVNIINWFEIPVLDMERARKFYESVLSIQINVHEVNGNKMGFFPYENGSGKLSGAIIQGEGHIPSMMGTLVYLNCNPDLAGALSQVERSGGKILLAKTPIGPEVGFKALLLDTEGNKIALHSQK